MSTGLEAAPTVLRWLYALPFTRILSAQDTQVLVLFFWHSLALWLSHGLRSSGVNLKGWIFLSLKALSSSKSFDSCLNHCKETGLSRWLSLRSCRSMWCKEVSALCKGWFLGWIYTAVAKWAEEKPFLSSEGHKHPPSWAEGMGGAGEGSRQGKATMVMRQFCPQMALARFSFTTAGISAGRPLTSPSATIIHRTQSNNMKTSIPYLPWSSPPCNYFF